ncbi:MAG TPA: sugar transferase [Bacteroidales bacterium]|nr:sugar transferase [Bacteroidales bacterium]
MDLFNTLVNSKVANFLRKWNLLNVVFGTIDILTIAFAFQVAFFINYYKFGLVFFTVNRMLLLFIGILPFWLITLYLIQVTEIPRTKRTRVLFFEYFQSSLVIAVILLIIYFIFKMTWISRLFLIELTFLGFIFLFLVRLVEYKLFKTYRARGFNYVNVVLIADDTSISFIDTLISNKEWGYRVIAIFTRSDLIKAKYEKTIILLPEEYIEVMNDLMEVDIIDEVLYVKKKVVPSEVRNVISSCEELGVIFRLKYDEKRINLTNATKTKIGDEKFLNFINIPYNSWALAIKKIMDLNVSLIMIILLSPFLITIALLIKISSPGPIIFKQKRVGLRGRMFSLYKFRTMVPDAELLKKKLSTENEMDGPVFKIKDDPRVTKIGKFLRKTGLDELPQLFNILKGEMSLIGPRPPIPSETQQYERWQLRRLSVKPGLSCFWQIKPDRNSIKFEKWMEMDLAYIDNWSLRLDFIILLKTIKTVFLRSGL